MFLPFLLRFGGGDARHWFAPLGSAHLARPIRVSRKQPIRSYGHGQQSHHYAARTWMLSAAARVARSWPRDLTVGLTGRRASRSKTGLSGRDALWLRGMGEV